MQDIFNDMDKVLAKFSDDIKEVFKNYHREEVKEEVKEEEKANQAIEVIESHKIKRITDGIVNDINLVIKNIDELLKALQTAISYLQMGKKDQSIIDELKAVEEKAATTLSKTYISNLLRKEEK